MISETAAPLTSAQRNLVEQVSVAARSLSDGGHDDFNQGQVSARQPGSDIFFIKNATTGFDECTPSDILVASVDPHAEKHPQLPPEVVLHQAVYAARPDVNAIVHSHAPYTLVFGATDLPLRAVSHDGAFFQGRTPRFTMTSNTILTLDVATAVASAIDDSPAAFLRNHGGVIVGKSIRHATVYAHMLERACQLQLMAEAVSGGYHSSEDEDIDAKREFNFADLSVRSYWEHLARRVKARQLTLN
ncbi:MULTISPECIES: class II aldolase/adducin family protein [Arthrobacter]|uniref:Class II aldolase/adducin family protein n=1 Tax=Arthrobacter terricola TaxID=2547396 RepID=A0A4R5K8B5_9MICC|nr:MULTISPECIES: class II aldolase/adducin family protein [Arthrobacter]MBT8163497.1 class II aldolase/adducin family protein [Arthrobacter sp. GN70]TDF89458.1 class II aldolase/adducin family protein [Arthrobacter terricola]